jgi:hypothetical protein
LLKHPLKKREDKTLPLKCNFMTKTILVAILLCLFGQYVSAQTAIRPGNIDTVSFHLSPKDKHVVVNGASLGWSIHPWSVGTDTCFVEMNGFNLELGPMGIIGGIWGTMYGLAGEKDENGNRISFFSKHQYVDSIYNSKYGTFVNGVSVSVGGIGEAFNKGVIINGLSCFSYKTTGLLVSGLVNCNYKSTGLSIAGLANVAHVVKGVQIGLINKCETGQVVQLGLFNRIGKRIVPIINFRFRKDSKTI